MSDAGRALSGFIVELFGVLGELLANAGGLAESTLRRYLAFLRRAVKVFGTAAVILLGVLVLGAVTRQEWLVSIATLLIGLAAAIFLSLSLPLGAPALALVREVAVIKRFVKVVGSLLLWALLLSLYFSVVPVASRPGAVFRVILVTFIVALFWAIYGIGPNPRRIYASIISVFIVTTLGTTFSFYFPQTTAVALEELDEPLSEFLRRLVGCLTAPSSCSGQQPAQEGAVHGFELPPSPPGNSQPGFDKKAVQSSIGHKLRPGQVSLELRSDPAGAEVFLDWVPKGRTPLLLIGKSIGGLLVVVKEGQQAWFRKINYQGSAVLDLNLPAERSYSKTHILLLVSGDGAEEAFSPLKGLLEGEGLTVFGKDEAKDLQQELTPAGGISHPEFRAWARARFDTDLLVTVRFHPNVRELDDQELRYLGIEGKVKSAVRTEVTLAWEVVDLRSGDHLAVVSGKGSSLAFDRVEGLQKALRKAAADTATVLRRKIQG